MATLLFLNEDPVTLNSQQNHSYSSFYLKHKGLLINLFSVLTFLTFDNFLGIQGVDQLEKAPWMAILFLGIYALEPWATYYSMGAFNQRREEKGITPIALHQWMGLSFLGIVFWAGRISTIGIFLMASLRGIGLESFFEFGLFQATVVIILLVREIFVSFYMASKKPMPNFKENQDFAADVILMIMLAFGQLIVGEVYRDVGMKGFDNILDIIYYLFPILLFFFVFYLPLRYIYTVEDFTFARTKWQKAEQVISFLIVFIGFLIAA